MSPELRPPRASRRLLATILATAVAAGCTSIPDGFGNTPPPVVSKVCTCNVLTGYLDVMQRIARGTPAEKAEIFNTAKHEFDTARTPSNSLRLALLLATPGHPATDRAHAQTLLREVIANPETLLPGEQALAVVELQQIDDYLNLSSEKTKLADESSRLDRANHHLMADNEELRKQNDELKAKLVEIEKIETRPSKKGANSAR